MEVVFEFKQTATYKDIIFGSNDYVSLDDLKQLVNDILSKVPTVLLNTCEDLGWKLVVTNTRNLEKEYNYDIKIYGLTDYVSKEFIVYADKLALAQSIYHELGHFIDYLFDISSDDRWYEIVNEESQYYPPSIFTQLTSPSECFADGYLWYLTETNKLARMHKTCDIFNNLMNNLDYLLGLKEIRANYNNKRKEIESKSNNCVLDVLSTPEDYYYG